MCWVLHGHNFSTPLDEYKYICGDAIAESYSKIMFSSVIRQSGKALDIRDMSSESCRYLGEEGSWQKEQQSRDLGAGACLCSRNQETDIAGADGPRWGEERDKVRRCLRPGGRKDNLEFMVGELGSQQKDVIGFYLERIRLLQEEETVGGNSKKRETS